MGLIIAETILRIAIIIAMCAVVMQHNNFDKNAKVIDNDQYIKIEMANALFCMIAILLTLSASCHRLAQ